jgi:VWFA-related protein
VKLARVFLCIATLAAIGGALEAGPARAQQPSSSLTFQVDATKFPTLTAVVTVLDAHGVPTTDLTAADFQAFENKTKLKIDSVASAQAQGLQLDTIIVIDTSGSMQGEPFTQATRAAIQFVNSMGPNDRATIAAFSDGPTSFNVPLTSDHQRLTDAITKLEAGGGTALYEAVQTSAFVAAASTAPRRAVIFLTDGENDTQKSSVTADESSAAARTAGVPVFTIGFGTASDKAYLRRIATDTQGQYHDANIDNVANVYRDIATLLRSQYSVTLTANGKADGKDGSLQIIATVDGTPAASIVTYKRGAAAALAAAPTAAAVTAPPKPPEKKSNLAAFVFAGVLVAAGGVAIAWLLLLWARRRRLRRAQLRVVAPNVRQAAAQPLDSAYRAAAFSAAAAAGVAVAAPAGTGRLREKNGTGQVYELGDGPAIIGSSPRACNIVLPASDRVAGEHARIWLRDGNYVLHHVAGLSRKTLVAGQEADWVTLEPGDEVTVGPHKLIFENPG